MTFDPQKQPPDERELWDNNNRDSGFTLDRHTYYYGWAIVWTPSQDPARYDIWINDKEGDCCFEYKGCLELEKGIWLARRTIRAVLEQNIITMQTMFDFKSSFENNLHRQIWRLDEGLEPIFNQPKNQD